MILLVWSLPALVVIGLIVSGRVSAAWAAAIGTALAVIAAAVSAPLPVTPRDLGIALARGAWIGWTIVPYIFGGLLFWQAAGRMAGRAAQPSSDADDVEPLASPVAGDDPVARRRRLFTACWLIGPFAEAATGFGVGMVGTITLVRTLGIAAHEQVAFALLSQTFIPWGAMGSGTIIGASFARFSPTLLALISSAFVAALLAVWLPLFWRLADRAGVGAPARERANEAAWLLAAVALLVGATWLLGPETALLASFGPIIVARFVLDRRPDRATLKAAARSVLPHLLLIGWLLLTRLVPPLRSALTDTLRLAPWSDAPGWSPLFHAGSWLLIAGIVTLCVSGRAATLPAQWRGAWRAGKPAILTVLLFSTMAETLSASGIAAAWAARLFEAFGVGTVLATPLLAGTFGVLTNSGTAGNSLFMSAQVALATQAGLGVPAVIALQHVSGTCLSLFSPVRMSMACALAGIAGRERRGYAAMAPFAIAGVLVLLAAAALIVFARIGS